MIMRRAMRWLGVAMIIGPFLAAFIGYFVFRFDPQTKIVYDGFGRQVSESPWFMRLIFGQERLWAGWVWFIGDLIIFWGSIWLGIKLAAWGFKEKV